MLKSAITTLLFFCFTFSSFSQVSNSDLKIFLDCDRCDTTYMKQNLANVQFVRDQSFSDVHLFFVTQRNGSGGREYEIDFIGKNAFEAINYKLEFPPDSDMTNADIRMHTLEHIKLGFVRVWL